MVRRSSAMRVGFVVLGALLAIAAVRKRSRSAREAGLDFTEICEALAEDTDLPYGLIIGDDYLVAMLEAGTTYEELLDYLDWQYS